MRQYKKIAYASMELAVTTFNISSINRQLGNIYENN